MICIRIFRTKGEAEWGKTFLRNCGVFAAVSEDTFNSVPIQEFGVPARYRLTISGKDLNRADRKIVLLFEARDKAVETRNRKLFLSGYVGDLCIHHMKDMSKLIR